MFRKDGQLYRCHFLLNNYNNSKNSNKIAPKKRKRAVCAVFNSIRVTIQEDITEIRLNLLNSYIEGILKRFPLWGISQKQKGERSRLCGIQMI